MITEREALARIAALCDDAYIDCPLGDAFRAEVLAIIAEVTPEPGDPLMPPETLMERIKADGAMYRIGLETAAGCTLDRDQARAVITRWYGSKPPEMDSPRGLLNALAACVRPVPS